MDIVFSCCLLSIGHAPDLELDTKKQDMIKKKEIGPKRSFSPMLREVKIPRILSIEYAVMTHDNILIILGTGTPSMSFARRRIT